ncbi:4'-phosphopantetheinyl transferase family protein [Glycomyces artemisiae]|uniref:4'-phosphopantetheinyl transferase n=1 Tax=Glycomyces artemisiae TaxID=1076443 RepID=A0A2T0UL32_9ACTN|nr:4'-phosphopantetheinyl transferase superfamily protein [Glycomyces artemisiae]PRY58641.1 4'-phosphopantetheinyl transferase [Glycomyces artemisiae]
MGGGFAGSHRAVRPVELRWSDGSDLRSAVPSQPDLTAGPLLWISRTDGPVTGLADLLGPEDMADAEPMSDLLARRRRLVGRAVLRTLLAACLGGAPADVRLAREPCAHCGRPHGRPTVAGAPLEFSVSRSGPWVLVAVARTAVGVDLESKASEERAAALAQRMHPAEAAYLSGLAGDRLRRAFTRTWVRKEAFLKALGTGLARDTRRDLVGAGPRPRSPQAGWAVADVLAPRGWTAALAVSAG